MDMCLSTCRDLPRGLQVVGQAINGLAEQAQVNPAGSVLHVAVCNGSDALAVSDGAQKLLSSGLNLLGSQADDHFSSMELLGSEGPHSSTASPKHIAQVRPVNALWAGCLVQGTGGLSILSLWQQYHWFLHPHPCYRSYGDVQFHALLAHAPLLMPPPACLC